MITNKRRPIKRLITEYKAGEGKAQVLDSPSQLTNILWRASQGELGTRNVAIVWMLFGAGMRINEVAQLKIKDVFWPNGELKKTFIIPALYTKTNKSRAAYIVVKQQRQALEDWKQQRLNERAMLSADGSFGGLRGDSPLFLSKKKGWRKFAMNVKRYETKSGSAETLVCSSLENLLRKLLKESGVQGGSSHSGRRTLATWLDRNGCDLELIRFVLNHESPEQTIEYIDPSRERIAAAFKTILAGLKAPKEQSCDNA